jgi:hypothetical protein
MNLPSIEASIAERWRDPCRPASSGEPAQAGNGRIDPANDV